MVLLFLNILTLGSLSFFSNVETKVADYFRWKEIKTKELNKFNKALKLLVKNQKKFSNLSYWIVSNCLFPGGSYIFNLLICYPSFDQKF